MIERYNRDALLGGAWVHGKGIIDGGWQRLGDMVAIIAIRPKQRGDGVVARDCCY